MDCTAVRRSISTLAYLCRAVGRSENTDWGSTNLVPLLVGIGLTDLPKYRGTIGPPALPVSTAFSLDADDDQRKEERSLKDVKAAKVRVEPKPLWSFKLRILPFVDISGFSSLRAK